MTINVTKRSGNLEPLNLNKIHKVLTWAAEGLDNVSVSQVEINSKLQFMDKVKTSDIHNILIKATADLITEQTPDYQYMAARLAIFNLRKISFNQFTPPSFYNHIRNLISKGMYDEDILNKYTKEEIDYLDTMIQHDRDFNFVYAAVKQLEGKYLVQDRVTNKIYETPQFLYMLVSMCLFGEYKEDRLKYVVDFYNAISLFKISLPTPIMAGVRTKTRQFSSCVLIECDDHLDSINATASSIVKYVSARAGIGINAGKIRALGSPIRNGEAFHTGCIPFYKYFQAAVKSCSQGGVRGGAATVFYPIWHLEVESLLVLKNNRGVEENRVRHMDYGVQINKLFYTRLIKGENITLFSPHDVIDMRDAFYNNQELFEELYVKYEQDESIRKKVVKAVDLFSVIMQERASTGRIYIQNIDHSNTHSSFIEEVAPVKQSNLCVSGETQILTDKGYVRIDSVVDTKVNVWNGEEWSEVDVVKTGEDQPLLTVKCSDGRELTCTEYHKFYVQEGDKVIEKRANELTPTDKLIKFSFPIIEGTEVLDKPYATGFHGSPDNHTDSHSVFVPVNNYTVESRLQWLAGYLDGNGDIYRHDTKEMLICVSTEFEFLRDVQNMLSTLGVNCEIKLFNYVEKCSLAENNSTDKLKDVYHLLFPVSERQKLVDLGINKYLKRLKITPEDTQPQATKFVTCVVTRLHSFGDTYCFTEPKRHMGVFNGILTGQCLEITLPTKPLQDVNDENGEIGLCTLSAINLGVIESLDDLDYLTELTVRSLDALLDYQDYPLPAGYNGGVKRRSLGVGVINYAYYLAKNGLKYSDGSALNLTHKTFERLQFGLLKASVKLAKEFGRCEYFDETKYSKGILPIDTYKKDLDDICKTPLYCDWEGLRKDILEYGLRNSTLSSLMPSETSAQISNSTNGIEPPRGYITVKASKDGILKQVVPDIKYLRPFYEPLWSIKGNKGYLDLVGIMQKFVDQSISTNTKYDPSSYENGKVPMKVLLQDLLYAYKLGLKTLYYHNTRDGADDSQTDIYLTAGDDCESGACKI